MESYMKGLDYKNKKWDKVIACLCESKKILAGGYEREIDVIIDECKNTSDFYRMCVCLARTYGLCVNEYLSEGNNKKVIEATYLSVKSFFMFCRMKKKDIPTKQVNTNLFSELESFICKAITIGCFDEFLDCYDNTIMGSLFLGKPEETQKLVDQIPDIDDKTIDVYYIKPQFLKNIYYALLEKDENLFKEELSKRIRKYRRNMVDYATIIDYTTIGLIKTAKLYGLNVDLNIVEIPDFLMEDNNNNEQFALLKIPFQNKIEECLTQK